MTNEPMRLIGPWGNAEKGKRYARPEGAGALDLLGQILEAASGDMASCSVELSAMDVRALGARLRRVAAGEDARHVFGQGKAGHRRSERLEKWAVAYAYWRTLAELLAAGVVSERVAKQKAVERAMRQWSDKDLSAATVGKYARALRDSALDYMQDMHRIGNGPDPQVLLDYLARHSHAGNEGPDLPPLTRKRT